MMFDLKYTDERWLDKTYTLKNIVRYNHRTRLTNETVAEHSFFVALIALDLCRKLNVSSQQRYECLIKALLHDMPETELNDITYDVKCRLGLYGQLKKYEDEYFLKYFHDDAELMINDDENIVNTIVKYADAVSVMQYALHELDLGNNGMKEIVDDAYLRLKNLETKLEALV